MKKIYLIHGWGGSPNSEGWFGWLKRECDKRRWNLIIPEMPNTDKPKIEEWVGKLKEIVNVDNNTYFIGHSIGCQAIMRFLEALPEKVEIGGAIFVAGWFNLKEDSYETDEERKIAKPWIEIPINFKKIEKHCSNFLAIFSDDDPFVPVFDSKIFEKELNAKIIIKKNQEHFNEVLEIPETLEFLT